MITYFLISLFIGFGGHSKTSVERPNCEIYKDDPPCYEACLAAMQAIRFPQGSHFSQAFFDKSIALCPTFDYAWFERAVPYLKRGQFIAWRKYIDEAVRLNPVEHLGYRGWCRFQFLRDYAGAIEDIERLEALISYDIGYSVNGDYHLVIAKGLCYRGMGEVEKGIAIIEALMQKDKYMPGLYDYLHLGVMQLEIGALDAAEQYLKKQLKENDYLAETYYYLAKIAESRCQKAAYQQYLKTALDYYDQGRFIKDSYSHPMDRVYRQTIQEALQKQAFDCE